MFKGNNNTSNSSKAMESNSPDRLNRIVAGTIIEGNIQCESNLRVDGEIRGTISTNGRLVVGPQGRIEGEVNCHNAEIEGELTGTITVGELLTLKATAKIDGTVVTGKLAVEPGAVINASVDMGGMVKELPNAKENRKQIEAEAATA